jgi:hypothetical protein
MKLMAIVGQVFYSKAKETIMEKTFFVNYPCPSRSRKGMMSYFPAGYKGIHYSFIVCGNCQAQFKDDNEHWKEMLASRIERPT